MTNFKKFIKDESGATAIEYGLLVALISIAAVATFGIVGDKLTLLFTEAGDKLTIGG